MKILFSSVKIVSETSEYFGQTKDILIENGFITAISDYIEPEADFETIEGSNLCVSDGWLDMRVHAKEPGYEHKEDLLSMSNAAMSGGFTQIALLPNTNPVIQTKESVNYLRQFSQNQLVDFFPMAAVTIDCQGKDFTEMLDLNKAGAVAFTDGEHAIQNADIFVKTLQYISQFEGVLIDTSQEESLSKYGQLHEGFTSTMLGMKGFPSIAEEMFVARNLNLLKYFLDNATYVAQKTGKSLLHFSCISTQKSVEMIRKAKANGLPVSCDVAIHQLIFTDTDLDSFDTSLKVYPPFRSKNDQEALWEGLADNTIDVIVSDHHPQDEESKKLEFDLAEFGVIGLETLFAVFNTYKEKLQVSTIDIVSKITTQPRKILNVEKTLIAVGQKANLTVFDTETEWEYSLKNILSKSKNSPFIGTTLKGKVWAVVNKGKLYRNI